MPFRRKEEKLGFFPAFFLLLFSMNENTKLILIWGYTYFSWFLSAKFHNILVELSLIFAIAASASTFILQVKKIFTTNKKDHDN